MVAAGDIIKSPRRKAKKALCETMAEGEIVTVEFTAFGIPWVGMNGRPLFSHGEAFSFQIAMDTQEETDRCWNAMVSNGGEASACGWCKDRWGIFWQITPRVLTNAYEPPLGNPFGASRPLVRLRSA